MVKEGGPLQDRARRPAAVRGNVTPQLAASQRALARGLFGARSWPLRYVGRPRHESASLEAVRQGTRRPCGRDELAQPADPRRPPERELRHLLDAIDMFDIDWMGGHVRRRVRAAERRDRERA